MQQFIYFNFNTGGRTDTVNQSCRSLGGNLIHVVSRLAFNATETIVIKLSSQPFRCRYSNALL
jgi:hypothetical protein